MPITPYILLTGSAATMRRLMGAMMLRLERDADFRRQQQLLGPQRASLFSWRKTTEQLLEVYKALSLKPKESASVKQSSGGKGAQYD